MDFKVLSEFDDLSAIFQGTVLATCRAIGFLSTFPIFTWLDITGILRLSIAIAMSSLLISENVLAELDSLSTFPAFVGLLFKEAFIGVGLGLLLGAPIWALQGAGDVIEMYRGASMEGVFHPVSASETTDAGRLFIAVGMAWYVSSGYLLLFIELFFGSYRIWPIRQMFPLFPNNSLELGVFLDWMMRYALILSCPILIILFLFEMALTLGSMSGKRLSLVDLSPVGKNGLFLVILPIYVAFSSVFLSEAFRLFGIKVFNVIGGMHE